MTPQAIAERILRENRCCIVPKEALGKAITTALDQQRVAPHLILCVCRTCDAWRQALETRSRKQREADAKVAESYHSQGNATEAQEIAYDKACESIATAIRGQT